MSVFNAIESEIFKEAYIGDVSLAFRMWCNYYFQIEPSPKQEILAVAGFQPSVLLTDKRAYEKAIQISTLLALGGIRSGKTFGVSLEILFKMWLIPELDCANVAPSVDQAGTMYRSLLGLISKDPFDRLVRTPEGKDGVQKHPYPQITLWNGSRIEFRSSGYECELLRSREWDIVNADEVQLFLEMGIRTLRGRVLGNKAGRRRMGLFSASGSPLATALWLKQWFDKARPDNPQRPYNSRELSIRFSILDNVANLGQEAVDELYKAYSGNPRLVEQELNGEFIDATTHPFPGFEAAFLQMHDKTGTVAGLEAQIQRELGGDAFDAEWSEYALPPKKANSYVMFWDLGRGRAARSRAEEDLMGNRGATVGVVLDVSERPWKQVAYKYIPRTYQWSQVVEYVRFWYDRYNGAEVGVDIGGPGDPVAEMLETSGIPIHYPIRFTGVATRGTNLSKGSWMAALQMAFDQELVKCPYLKIPFEQVNHYDPGDDDAPQDYVVALGGAVWLARQQDSFETHALAPSIQVYRDDIHIRYPRLGRS